MSIKIVQIIIDVDGQLCHAAIPKGMNHMILSILQANDDGKIKAVKLPESARMVSLAEALKSEVTRG